MQPHSTRVCLAPCSTLFVRRIFIGAASSGQSLLPSPPIILLMDSWAPFSWGCYGGCHNQVLDRVFWLPGVFVRGLPRNGIAGLLFSRCYEFSKVCSVGSASSGCSKYLVWSVSPIAAAILLGAQAVLLWFLFSLHLLRWRLWSLIYWWFGQIFLW